MATDTNDNRTEALINAVKAIQSGDEDAFQTIYGETYRRTLSEIRRYCSDADAWDDLLQDTYIQLYNHIGQIKEPGAIQGWLNVTSGRLARDYGISRDKHPTKLMSEMEDEDGNPMEIEDTNESVHPELIADRKAVAEIVNQVLEMLPKEQREALLMVYGQRITIKELAEKLKVSENTIKSRLYQGRQKLMAHKADFRRLGVELPAVGIATLIAVTFEENLAAQAATGVAAGAVLANAASTEGTTASSGAASAAAAAAGTKAAAAGMSVGVKAVIGLVSAAVIAGGGAAAVKTMVIDKQNQAEETLAAEETMETETEESELSQIREPERVFEDLYLTPNEIGAKYGKPDYYSIGWDVESDVKLFQYEEASYQFMPYHGQQTGSNDEHYDIIISLHSASALSEFGITDKTDIHDFIDAIGGTVYSYFYWTEEDAYGDGEDLWRGKTGQTSVTVLSQNNIVYELFLDNPNIIDPNNSNDYITAELKETAERFVDIDYSEDNTAEFYNYLKETEAEYNVTDDNSSGETEASVTENASDIYDHDKAKAYYAMINSEAVQQDFATGSTNDIMKWQYADIDGDGTDEILFANGNYSISPVGIGKIVNGEAVYLGAVGRNGGITYYPGTGYLLEEGWGAGGRWEALYLLADNKLTQEAYIEYSDVNEYGLSDEDYEELYYSVLKGVEIPVESGKENEAEKYMTQFKAANGDGVYFSVNNPNNYLIDVLRFAAS